MGKGFEKQIKAIEDQGEKQIDALKDLKDQNKQLDNISDYKDDSLQSKERDDNNLIFTTQSTGEKVDFSGKNDTLTFL